MRTAVARVAHAIYDAERQRALCFTVYRVRGIGPRELHG